MADQAEIGDNTSRKKLAQLVVGMVVGLGFGLVMSLVSNGFVSGVLWLTALRETHLVVWLGLDPGFTSMTPLICLQLLRSSVGPWPPTFSVEQVVSASASLTLAIRSFLASTMMKMPSPPIALITPA